MYIGFLLIALKHYDMDVFCQIIPIDVIHILQSRVSAIFTWQSRLEAEEERLSALPTSKVRLFGPQYYFIQEQDKNKNKNNTNKTSFKLITNGSVFDLLQVRY